MTLSGSKLAGGNPKNKRIDNDFYATNPVALKMLLEKEQFDFSSVLEPCVGNGMLASVIKEQGCTNFTGLDIVNRGYENTIVDNFLTHDFNNNKYTSIISNPPYSLAQEFIEKSMDLLADNGKCAMFLKIQFLEGVKRQEFYNNFPPKYIYVFTKRMATWQDGNPKDENGKNWATTMCHAWFVWEKNSTSEPIVRWL